MFLQNADGDVTEANFGNDDETMGRLEDMGIAGGGEIGGDVSRQNSGAAQRRRQVGMLVLMLSNALSKARQPSVIRLVMPRHCPGTRFLQQQATGTAC